MLAPHSIAAVVVLYHPTPEVVENIQSWAGQVEFIIAVDNTEGDISAIVSSVAAIEKVILIRSGENLGIARALNIGAEKAIAEGYDFLLTMDQDSSAAPDMVAHLFACMLAEEANTGIVSPFHITKSSGAPPVGDGCKDVMTPMTSGCLMNLDAYSVIGPFRDDFFIDFVDNEYCLRLRQAGFLVLRANAAHLQHSVGDTHKYGPFIATNHCALRRYYKTRNRFWVFREYFATFPWHCLFDLVRFAKEIGSIVLFEEDKILKLQMMWRGFIDFMRNDFGRYNNIEKVKL